MLELKDLQRGICNEVHDIALLLNDSIISDDAHYTLNKIFIACLVTLKKNNCLGESKQMEPTTPTKQYFLDRNFAGPEKKTRLEYMYYFCHRGREIIREILTER